MRYAGLVIAVMLAGCALETVRDKMGAYSGQPVSTLIDKLGIPSDERVIAGRKVYIWSSSNFVDGTNFKCQIRAIVDERNMVVSSDFEGNQGGCQGFAARLRAS